MVFSRTNYSRTQGLQRALLFLESNQPDVACCCISAKQQQLLWHCALEAVVSEASCNDLLRNAVFVVALFTC